MQGFLSGLSSILPALTFIFTAYLLEGFGTCTFQILSKPGDLCFSNISLCWILALYVFSIEALFLSGWQMCAMHNRIMLGLMLHYTCVYYDLYLMNLSYLHTQLIPEMLCSLFLLVADSLSTTLHKLVLCLANPITCCASLWEIVSVHISWTGFENIMA